MEMPWQSWFSDLDMDENDFFNQCPKNNSFDEDEEFLREILHQPSFSSESDSTHSSTIQNTTATAVDGGTAAATTPTVSSLSFDDSGSQIRRNGSSSILSKLASFSDKPASSSSPSTYILSFDNSAVLPATTDDGYRKHESAVKSTNHEQLDSSTGGGGGGGGGGGTRASLKRTLENHNSEPKANQGTKKSRSSSETLDHIMAERKRRQELTEKFIALSATIPGLKKIDKASILSEAINHVKQLQERVRELEEQNKKISVESVSYIKKSSLLHSADEQDTTSCEMSSEDCYRINETLPEVEARVLQKEILIRIHCEKQKGIMLNILAQLKSLHFSIISNSVLPFGNSTLDITIIAEVGDEYNIPMKELVKKLRVTLLKSLDNQV